MQDHNNEKSNEEEVDKEKSGFPANIKALFLGDNVQLKLGNQCSTCSNRVYKSLQGQRCLTGR
jgi:hypothetical protein